MLGFNESYEILIDDYDMSRRERDLNAEMLRANLGAHVIGRPLQEWIRRVLAIPTFSQRLSVRERVLIIREAPALLLFDFPKSANYPHQLEIVHVPAYGRYPLQALVPRHDNIEETLSRAKVQFKSHGALKIKVSPIATAIILRQVGYDEYYQFLSTNTLS